MPSMDILTILSKHYGSPVHINKATVRRWKQFYLKLYDDTVDDLGAKSDYKHDRRIVIESTFENLEAVCFEDAEETESF